MATEARAPMYGAIAEIYDRLDDWIVATWHEQPVPARVAFLRTRWARHGRPVRDVLDLCCGTGSVLHALATAGYRVTGLDRSPQMLGLARRRLGDGVPLIEAALPDLPLPDAAMDAVCSTGAALSYTPGEEELTGILRAVHRVLRPGGTFLFDVLSRHMLTEHAGRHVWAADQGDFAFLWEFTHPDERYSDAFYTQFLRRGGADSTTYERTGEQHRLYVLDHPQVRRAAERAGFAHAEVLDNYTDAPAHPHTLYDTWALTRDRGGMRP
ncbi:class I SAM-dependent methyltransferase [Streptomyces benahoarensis]|uniref:Class I SAM-dependent methyltransferase n=1 Tax=Streptomyces benahoarensis TaxID=2595054 RepID=A0A553ZQX9_9ACTN|nr:class I SAM-dependent methyltransferase [Streptomyces benahoarensis]TSB32803.1 class I SAM-dependent methyltransferase [Streptomyces benahoarensis]TSB43870.1 class I SAM-dependent methyltransferase [Streptomyces benahoarensis]